MEVWIETADAVDVHDHVFRRAMSGVAAINSPENLKGDPRGWPIGLELVPVSRYSAPICHD